MSMTVEVLLALSTQRLQEAGSSSPQIDADVLLCHSLDKPRSFLFTWPDKLLTEAELVGFEALLARRLSGEPVAYITGTREFWSLPLKVSPSTLIPRPDTERLVELALEKIPTSGGAVLDLGTGTGAIALAIASERPDCDVTGIDLRSEAAELASDNGRTLEIKNACFLTGSWYTPLETTQRFSVIVSNPPYIDETDPHLSQGDVRFEPKSALVAPEKGLGDLRTISEQGREFLQEGGWLLMEHGYEQGKAVRQILLDLGYEHVSTAQDYADLDRVTLGCWKS